MNRLKFLLLLICLRSCTKEEIWEHKQSLIDWNNLKKDNGNSYKYTTSWSSWVGAGGKTTLTINKGIVISRSYEAYRYDEVNGDKIITESYEENQENLNSNDSGSPTLTIDQLYDSCINDYLVVNRNSNKIYFSTNDIGIVSLCGFVPKNCADDCFRGFRIDSFEWL